MYTLLTLDMCISVSTAGTPTRQETDRCYQTSCDIVEATVPQCRTAGESSAARSSGVSESSPGYSRHCRYLELEQKGSCRYIDTLGCLSYVVGNARLAERVSTPPMGLVSVPLVPGSGRFASGVVGVAAGSRVRPEAKSWV